MQDYEIIFYLLTSFIVFGSNLFENKNFNFSGLCFNLVLLIPFIILKIKVETFSYYLNKNYEVESLKNMLKSNINLSDREIKKYIRKIDLINDIDEDGIDMVINYLTELGTKTGANRELELILKRINVDYMKNNFELFDLKIDKAKFNKIINETLKNITN